MLKPGYLSLNTILRLLSTKQGAFRKIARERAAFDEITETYIYLFKANKMYNLKNILVLTIVVRVNERKPLNAKRAEFVMLNYQPSR